MVGDQAPVARHNSSKEHLARRNSAARTLGLVPFVGKQSMRDFLGEMSETFGSIRMVSKILAAWRAG